ncbi:hypothetical protein [Prochlorothrix hollandica]|uniref:hypothetical protein n=1 Tax=Prochlorothrix hollandica TaxID=1223 RepID=UPI00034C4B4F|nr:hypothetical protein [Prochlorothrix hollandica]
MNTKKFAIAAIAALGLMAAECQQDPDSVILPGQNITEGERDRLEAEDRADDPQSQAECAPDTTFMVMEDGSKDCFPSSWFTGYEGESVSPRNCPANPADHPNPTDANLKACYGE